MQFDGKIRFETIFDKILVFEKLCEKVGENIIHQRVDKRSVER